METRKVQLTGGSTYTVSLPKDWAQQIDLETGDTLQLFARPDRTLVIQPVDEEGRWATTVDVGGVDPPQLRQVVHALYTAGFDRITLTAPSGLGDRRRVISTAARKLVGLEVVESTATEVTLRTLLDSATVSIEQSTLQLEQVTRSMHQDAVTALFDGDAELADLVVERDDQVDRLYGMVSRHFQRSLERLREIEELDLNQARLHEYHTTARQLERVADHAEKLAHLATRFESPPETFEAELTETADAALTVVTRATAAVFGEADADTAFQALDRRDDVIDDLDALERDLHERDVPESHLVALVVDSLTRTAEYGGNIAEAALQTAARDELI